MRCQIISRWRGGAATAVIGMLLACTFAAAQAPEPPAGSAAQVPPAAAPALTLIPNYAPGSRLYYAIAIHSDVGARAHIETTAEAEMHILAGAAPGRFDAELRFTRYATKLQASDSTDRKELDKESALTRKAALVMAPVQVRLAAGRYSVVSRPHGPGEDQAVEMLVELARTDILPSGPVRAGDRWTRTRNQNIPGMNASVPLTMECSLTGIGKFQGQATATIALHSHGSATLPPGALPGSQRLARQGLVPEAGVTFDTTATDQYRSADAILVQSQSDTHDLMHIRFVGPSPQARVSDSDIHSSATVRLEKIVTD